MYSQLRDVLGDSVFVGFLRDYYARWALKHVDERAMRASAERMSGRNLAWFFDQWVHDIGVMDYQLDGVRSTRDASGSWVTEATVRRRGEYAHAILVGVRTAGGWTFGRMTREPYDREIVRIATRDEPLEIRLDPFHFSWDWDRRNDARGSGARTGFDWPFLTQSDRERSMRLFRPMAWYSEPGGATVGLRQRSSYLGWLDKSEIGLASAPRGDRAGAASLAWSQRLQVWARVENLYLPFLRRPAVGWRGGVASLDDIIKVDVGKRMESIVARRSRVDDVSLAYALPQNDELLPEGWSPGHSADLSISSRTHRTRSSGSSWFTSSAIVAGVCANCAYLKLETSAGGTQKLSENSRISARAYLGAQTWDNRMPTQRALFLSAADPVSTFENHWWRPRESLLKQTSVNWLPLGGAALRGYHWSVQAEGVAAANVELSRNVAQLNGTYGSLSVALSAFGDAGYVQLNKGDKGEWLLDAGAGFNVRGRLFDTDVTTRLDFPIFVNRPELSIDQRHAGRDQLGLRWVITFNDIW
jgi:hypothetical protein